MIKLLVVAATALLVPRPATLASRMTAAATGFLATLTESQLKQAQNPLDAAERGSWLYVPGQRTGVNWADMTEPQKEAARHLLKVSLSEAGYNKVETIRTLEQTLRELENGNPGRDTNLYWFLVYGQPDDVTTWAWRYEGHHVSLNFTLHDGRVVASTPQFLGSNPADVKSGPMKGTRVLAREQDLAFRLLDSLSEGQKKEAVLAGEAPNDIITGNSRKAAIQEDKGLHSHDMTNAQRQLLMELVRTHAEVQAPEEQLRRMKAVDENELVFAWLGPPKKDGKHYYRIQGKTFLIEFDDTQDDGNHIHTVWRDFDGDFGPDELAEHYLHDHDHDHR